MYVSHVPKHIFSRTLDRSICKGLVQFVGYFLEASSGNLFATCRM